MNLYQKHRPATLEDIHGNEKTVLSMRGLFQRKEGVPGAFLLIGPSGCGKTTFARIFSNMLECSEYDYKEIDVADFRGIDTIREIRQKMMLRPMHGKYRFFVLDECHQLSKDAQNGLLKALEDTPAHVKFVLCTTDPEKLLPTIRTRCTTFEVELLNPRQMQRLLAVVAKKEGVAVPEDVLLQIATDCGGSPRKGLVILDKILDLPVEEMKKVAKQSEEVVRQVNELSRLLLERAKWPAVAAVLKSLQKTEDAEKIRRAVLGYMQAVLLNSGKSQAALVIDCFSKPTYDIGFPGVVVAAYGSIA